MSENSIEPITACCLESEALTFSLIKNQKIERLQIQRFLPLPNHQYLIADQGEIKAITFKQHNQQKAITMEDSDQTVSESASASGRSHMMHDSQPEAITLTSTSGDQHNTPYIIEITDLTDDLHPGTKSAGAGVMKLGLLNELTPIVF